MLKEMIEYIAKSLVDNPDEVHVSEVEGEQTSVIESASRAARPVPCAPCLAPHPPRLGNAPFWRFLSNSS